MTLARLTPECGAQLAAGTTIANLASAAAVLARNALDAGARSICVSVDAERLALSCADDGNGIALADSALLGERSFSSRGGDAHALGCRGEELWSLAQLCVLHIDCASRSRGSSAVH